MSLFKKKNKQPDLGPFNETAKGDKLGSAIYTQAAKIASEGLEENDSRKGDLAQTMRRVAGAIKVGAIDLDYIDGHEHITEKGTVHAYLDIKDKIEALGARNDNPDSKMREIEEAATRINMIAFSLD